MNVEVEAEKAEIYSKRRTRFHPKQSRKYQIAEEVAQIFLPCAFCALKFNDF
jgi:hypothetical protein